MRLAMLVHLARPKLSPFVLLPLHRRLSSATKWTPRTLITHLDNYVVGQQSAKRALCVALYNHVLRVQQLEVKAEQEAIKVRWAHNESDSRGIEELLVEARSKAAPRSAAAASVAASTTTSVQVVDESHEQILSDWSGQTRGQRYDSEGFPVPEGAQEVIIASFPATKTKSVKAAKRKVSAPTVKSLREGFTGPHLVVPTITPPPLPKSNVLLLGPSGSGKSLLLHTLSKALGLPFLHVDATPLTQAGYVGEDAENIVARLLSVAGGDAALAGKGVVVIDEIDKLARRPGDKVSKDVSGEGVQQALLRILEGAVIQVPADKVHKNAGGTATAASDTQQQQQSGKAAPWWPPGQEPSQRSSLSGGAVGAKTPAATLVDTSGVLFVLCGAFVGLGDVVRARLENASAVAPATPDPTLPRRSNATQTKVPDDDSAYALTEPEDLTTYGMIPEFVGRVPVLASLGALSQDELLRVLTEPKDSLVSSYTSLFAAYQIELRITNLALRSLAQQATARRTGARQLRRLMELRLRDAMFDAPGGDTRYALLDEEAASGRGSVKLFGLGEKYKWESSWEEEQLASLPPSSEVRTARQSGSAADLIRAGDRGPGMGVTKQKTFKQKGLHGAGLGSTAGVGKEASQRRTRKTWGMWSRGEPDEGAVRRWNRARLVRPSRVGNLRIVADDKHSFR